jgi:hypothetical protein
VRRKVSGSFTDIEVSFSTIAGLRERPPLLIANFRTPRSLSSSRLLKKAIENWISPLSRFDFWFPGQFSAILPLPQSR